ncbi:ankyrin-1-like [Diabrotica virgifera virgifera]|uniref:Uncharacterized protein n=1 Tax=Diabrotica virgifera virgifera TaxID=50390 RepID=A0ABM5JJJ6_DIAVI|nr:ankyrin-1-like [Diabrotica virgifera virgifera]
MDINSDQLTVAIRCNNYTEVASLLDKGLDVNGVDSEGYRPLHEAVKRGYLDIVELLLKRSANVNLSTSRFLTTPLHLAAIFGHLEVVKLLITYGASLETKCDIGLPADYRSELSYVDRDHASYIIQNAWDFDIQGNFTTPLTLAADCGNTEVVKLLIERGADVNKSNDDGCNVLHIASGYGDVEIVSLLLQKESNLEARINLCGSTPLHLALDTNKRIVIDLLLHAGADVMAKDRSGRRPLDIVCDIINSLERETYLRDNFYDDELYYSAIYDMHSCKYKAKRLIQFMLLVSKDIEIKKHEDWAGDFGFERESTYYTFCHKHKRKYQKNIKQMEACLIKNTTVSVYTFLQALYYNKKNLLTFLYNQQLRQEVKNIDKYISKYKEYSSIAPMVMKKVQESVRRLDLLEAASTAMEIIAPNLVLDCRRIILNYLSNGDLHSLTESVSFPNY